ncbi:hypothetical protein U0L90_09105 [Flavobacteriaceae sp. LMIT009]
MIRKIIDYQKLDKQILKLLVEKFPDGYGDSDIITFRNAKNEVIEAVEINTDDTIYLIKIGKRLTAAMEELDKDGKENIDDDSSEMNSNNMDEALELPDN